MTPVKIRVLAGEHAVWKLPPDVSEPDLCGSPIVSMTRTAAELSGVSPVDGVPSGATVERGWTCLEVAGPLAFELTGILASISAPLADAGLPIFVVSTYDTDYVLVRSVDLEPAIAALEAAGHEVVRPGG